MSTLALAPVISVRTGRRIACQQVTPLRVLRSEWIKLRSLSSAKLTLAVSFLLMAGIGLMTSVIAAGQWFHLSASSRASFDAVGTVLQGYQFAELAIGILGVLVISSEYSSGMIRATFAAIPWRLPVLWAKAGVFGAVSLVTMTIASFAAFFAGMAILSSQHLQVAFSAPGVARAVFGAALYLAVVGLLGVAFGALLRNIAGAIAALFGLLMFVPVLVGLLPSTIASHISPYLPSNAGQALLNVHHQAGSLSPWAGFAVMCAYAVAALAAAAYALRRRDA
jgi:ABC-type transport system involved in multi-copper enzyme maturation permease subunit